MQINQEIAAFQPEFASVKEELWQRLMNYLQDTADPRIEGNDPFKGMVLGPVITY